MSKIPTAARKDAYVLRLWESDVENSDGGGAGDISGVGCAEAGPAAAARGRTSRSLEKRSRESQFTN